MGDIKKWLSNRGHGFLARRNIRNVCCPLLPSLPPSLKDYCMRQRQVVSLLPVGAHIDKLGESCGQFHTAHSVGPHVRWKSYTRVGTDLL